MDTNVEVLLYVTKKMISTVFVCLAICLIYPHNEEFLN